MCGPMLEVLLDLKHIRGMVWVRCPLLLFFRLGFSRRHGCIARGNETTHPSDLGNHQWAFTPIIRAQHNHRRNSRKGSGRHGWGMARLPGSAKRGSTVWVWCDSVWKESAETFDWLRRDWAIVHLNWSQLCNLQTEGFACGCASNPEIRAVDPAAAHFLGLAPMVSTDSDTDNRNGSRGPQPNPNGVHVKKSGHANPRTDSEANMWQPGPFLDPFCGAAVSGDGDRLLVGREWLTAPLPPPHTLANPFQNRLFK